MTIYKQFLLAIVLMLGMACAMQPKIALANTEIVLTITGTEGSSLAGQKLTFTRDDLRAIDVSRFETNTIWTDGLQSFTGTRLHALIQHLGIKSGNFRAYAVNDYAVNIPISDATPDGPIIAYENNGQEMTLRSKGPLWIVYPYDQSQDYRSEVTYSRSIWQMDRLELLP